MNKADITEESEKEEEHYIANESPEITVGENIGWIRGLVSAFPALANKNYQLYFSGQLVSLIGTWMQIVAQGWLVLQLTHSAFLIGLIAALATFPTLLLTLFGGVIVDRFPKKKILLFTQTSAMILAFILGILTVLHMITIWQIGLIAFLLGVVNAVDAPARQAFVSEIVTREQMSSAIALNSGIFNAARVIGPSIAGVLIVLIGSGGAFLINSLSYVGVLIALLMMKVNAPFKAKYIETFSAIKEGLIYSFSHPIIRTLILLTGIASIFGWSYTTIMPVIASHQFHLGASGLGYLYAATGLGSLLATILVSMFSKKVSPVVFIIGGNCIFTITLFLFSFTENLHAALILLFFVGFGLIAMFSTINTVIQSLVSNELRGRVISIYILMFVGLSPIGNFQIGLLSEKMGTGFAIRMGAIVVFFSGLIIYFYQKKIRIAYEEYKKR